MTDFTPIASADEIVAGAMKRFVHGDVDVVVANVGGDFFAFAGMCTCLSHFTGYQREANEASLADGDLSGSLVTCPVHGTIYDVRDGAPVKGPGEVPVNTYEVRQVHGELRIASMTNAERRFWNAA